jgi:hypothetical protein
MVFTPLCALNPIGPRRIYQYCEGPFAFHVIVTDSMKNFKWAHSKNLLEASS